MRISLAQVGKWIVDLGEVPAESAAGVPAEFAADELDRVVNGERNAVRPIAPSETGGPAVRNATLLGPAVGSTWLSSADMAGLGRLEGTQ